MRRPAACFLLGISFLLTSSAVCRQDTAPTPTTRPAALPTGPLYKLTEPEIDLVLRDLAAHEPDLRNRVVAIARRFIGQPYKLGLLGEGGREPYDRDPLYCLTASDCVTFVEQVYALALSSSWADFLPTLNRIRYRDGEISIRTRNHFTEADWNINNAWLFDDITMTLANGRVHVPLRQRVNRKAFFRKLGLIIDTPDENFVGAYIPRKNFDALLPELHDADVAEIVRGTTAAPFVSHMGLIAHDPAGRVTFIHSGDPAVRELPLRDYLAKNTKVIGMKFLRPRESLARLATPPIVAFDPRVR